MLIFIGFVFIDVTTNVVYRITNKVKNDFSYVIDDEAVYCYKKGIYDKCLLSNIIKNEVT